MAQAVDDYKGENIGMTTNDDNSGNSSSSSSDSDVPEMSKSQRQLNKMEMQVNKHLFKINSIRNKRNDVNLHETEETQLQTLLLKVKNEFDNNDGANIKSLRYEFKQIKILFRTNSNVWKQSVKEEKAKKKAEREARKAEKAFKKGKNEKSKKEKSISKEQKKLEREERKKKKLEFKNTLEKAKIEQLPNDLNQLTIYVDGWNISGCFGGRNRSKSKLIKLLQDFYNGFVNDNENNNHNGMILQNIELFYDGNGKNRLDNNVNITFSGKNIIVDDLWIEVLSKKSQNERNNIVCVTSDRELTVRLYNIGVKVMKSGRFFKGYLTPTQESSDHDIAIPDNDNNNNDNDNNNNDNNNGNDDVDINMDAKKQN